MPDRFWAHDQLVVHDGGTFGFASSMVWDQKKRAGVVVLSNHVAAVGDVARHLLRPSRPLAKPTGTKRIKLPEVMSLRCPIEPACVPLEMGNGQRRLTS